MAKRPSARRTSDADDVDEGDGDDAFAWETPKKGKKETGKQKSPTGKKRRPSAEDAEEEEDAKEKSGKKKLGKSSGSSKLAKSGRNGMEGSSRSKKSGSARTRPSSGDDDEEGDTSGRRRRAPPPRKKSSSPVMLISIGTLTVILIGGILMINKNRTPAPQVNHQNDLERILQGGKEGEAAFREWNKAKNGGGGNENQAYNTARTKLQKAVEELQALLDQPQYRNGEDLKKEYEGYEQYLQKWAELLVDIEKGSTLGNG